MNIAVCDAFVRGPRRWSAVPGPTRWEGAGCRGAPGSTWWVPAGARGAHGVLASGSRLPAPEDLTRGARATIGVGNSALGQVISLPQCGLTYPNEWFPTPMPQQDSEGPVVEALAAAGRPVVLRNWTDQRRSHSENAWPPGRPSPGSARHGLLSQRCPRFHSDTTLCKRYNTCKVWYPFENSTSLARLLPVPARRTRLPFEDSASLAKRTTQTRREPAGTPQARVPRECRSAPRTAHAKAPAKARAPTAHTVMGPMGAQGHHHSCTAFKFCIPRSKGMACGVRPIV